MSWTPASMGAELLQWLKADAITGLSNNDPVSLWLDSSLNARNMTGSGTARPLYLTNQINGLPAIDFDGSNDLLSSGAYSLAGQKLAMTGVFMVDSLKNFQAPWNLHNGASPNFPAGVGLTLVSSSGQIYGGGPVYVLSTASVFPSAQFCILTVVSNDLFGVGMRLNGKSLAPLGGGAGTPPITNFTGTAYTHLGDGGSGLGGGRYFDGKLPELVVCDNTYGDDIWLEGYLAHKYAITLSASHPFYSAAPTSGPRQSGGISRLINGGLVRGQVL